MFKNYTKQLEFNLPFFKFVMQQKEESYKPKKPVKPIITKYKYPKKFRRN